MPVEFGQLGASSSFHTKSQPKGVTTPTAAAAVNSQLLAIPIPKQYNALSNRDDSEQNSTFANNCRTIEEIPNNWNPAFDSPTRESTPFVATFNLLNTVVGGGALSIPYAFKKCGWFGGLLIVFFSVQISTFTLGILCTMARKLGCDTYSDVVKKTMGSTYAELLDSIQFFMLFLVIIAFLILIRDISGDILEFAALGDSNEGLGAGGRTLLLYGVTTAMLPLMMQKSLHALRHVSYIGSASVLLLLVVLTLKMYKANTHGGADFFVTLFNGGPRGTAQMWPENLVDVFTALPIILIAFLCQFNVVSVYAKMTVPTEERITTVLQATCNVSGLIYALFGLSGYFFAFEYTADNVLNNFSSRDPALVAARLGLVLTLMCQVPMVLLPCRESGLRIVANAVRAWEGFRAQRENLVDEEVHDAEKEASPTTRVASTIFLIILCVFFAELVPGVSTIWTVAGSSISLILAFLFPALCYVALWKRLPVRVLNAESQLAFVLLGISVFMIVLCTLQTIHAGGGAQTQEQS